jgi:hypothetical protein
MFGVIPVTFANLLVAAVVSVGLIILGLYLFQRIWLKNYDFQFPRGKVVVTRPLYERRKR